jgi:hypothetical protein
MKLVARVILMLAIGCITGCATGPIYRQPGVTSDNPAEIAIIKMDQCLHSQCLIIVDIDGKSRGPGWFNQYELLPGERTLKLKFMSPGINGARAILVKFDARPGLTYEIRGNVDYATMRWNPQVVNTETGQVVSHQTGTAFAF